MVILLPELNLLNFPLFFILSLMYRIKAYTIKPAFLYRFKGKIELLDLPKYFDWEKSSIIKSEAVEILSAILSKLSGSKWQIVVRNHNLDLSSKIRQELQKDIQKLTFFKNILCSHRGQSKIYVINSLKILFLSKLDKSNAIFCYPAIRALSGINILLDRLYYALINLCRFVKLEYQVIYGIIYNEKKHINVRYIYDGIGPHELSLNEDKITFSWLVDDKLIHKKEILFLLPKGNFQVKEHFTATHFGMNKFSSYKILFSVLLELHKAFVKNILLPRFSLEHLMKTEFTFCILQWAPLIESLKTKVYICNDSRMNIEEPAVLYFNALGIRTMLLLHSVNGYSSLNQGKNNHLRSPFFCNVLADTLVVWNRSYKEFINEHFQKKLNVKVIGPIISGEENVMNLKREDLFKKLGIPYMSNSKYLVLFDSPPHPHQSRVNSGWYPDFKSEEYNYAFIRDIYKLLSDFQNLVLIFKPKKSWAYIKFVYSSNFEKSLKNMEQNRKVVFLDYDVNPWIPIAMADLCVSLPFGSPTVAALHYGKPAIFYDPLDIIHNHRYAQLEGLIAHNFDQLKKLSEKFLFNSANFEQTYRQINISDFTGAEPGTNSGIKFREFIKNYENI